MALELYNTLTHRVEELRPIREGEVRMYTCGPTIYHFVHIGNFRTFLFQDLLRRYIQYKGFELKHVMNITDVEDKIIARAKDEGVSIEEYTKRYEEAFYEDMALLRIQRPETMPRATEHIPEMLALMKKLREKDYVYTSEGSTYYRVRRFEGYGKLARLQPDDEVLSEQNEEEDRAKEHAHDFVLWKGRREGETYWDSPFGPGRPGWHLGMLSHEHEISGRDF